MKLRNKSPLYTLFTPIMMSTFIYNNNESAALNLYIFPFNIFN